MSGTLFAVEAVPCLKDWFGMAGQLLLTLNLSEGVAALQPTESPLPPRNNEDAIRTSPGCIN